MLSSAASIWYFLLHKWFSMNKIFKPQWLRRSSFRRQLTLVFSTGVIAAALISALISSWSGSQSARENFVRQGRQITENLAKQSPLALLYGSAENAREAVNATLAFPDVRYVAIYAPGNRLLVERGARQPPPASPPALQGKPDALLESDNKTQWTFVAPVFSGEHGEEMSPFEIAKRSPELLGFVRVSLSKDSLHAMMWNIFASNMLTSLSLAALLLLVLRAVTARVTQPLSDLAQIMRRAEQGELKVRAQMQGPRDITDMAHAFNEMMSVLEAREAELRKNRDDAIEGARIKGQFTANVGHEIRTPMNGVLGMLDLLREMHLTRKQHDYVEIARNSGQLLLTLLNDLLDFSKLEVGKLNLENIRFNLRHSVEDALELLAEAAHRKHLELAYFMAADVPQFVYGDPTRLRQILTNLVSNAIKFTNEGDVAVYIKWELDDNATHALRFEVKDTGIGIDDKAQKTVFDSYAQADGWTTRKYGGTGLGLTISRQLVKMMGGEIGVTSKLGCGSTFWFTLRLQADDSSAGQLPIFEGLRGLVIERVECSRMFLGAALTSSGIEVEYAASPAEVRSLFEQSNGPSYDILIVNDALGGADIVRAARSYAGYENMPAVLMGKMQTAIHSADTESIVWTTKPVRHLRLLESIGEALGTKSANQSGSGLSIDSIPAFVLIVEDNVTNQLVASGMLNQLGCRVDIAQNGREGVEAVARIRYDIILMDCNMPEMDGYEATTRIRGLSANKDTIVIAMTANVHPGEVEKCLSVGMNDYLSKPLSLEALREKIVKWMAPPESSQARLEQARASYATTLNREVILDSGRFTQLKKLFGNTMSDFVAIYLEEVPAAIQKLKAACAQTHTKQIVNAAHSIKGTSINLGLEQLATLAKEMEQLARDGELGAVRAALSLLDDAFARAQEMLKAELERISADADT